jgi:hypothetical protein
LRRSEREALGVRREELGGGLSIKVCGICLSRAVPSTKEPRKATAMAVEKQRTWRPRAGAIGLVLLVLLALLIAGVVYGIRRLTSAYLTVADVREIVEVESPATLDEFWIAAEQYSPDQRILTMPRDTRVNWVRKISRSKFDDYLQEFPKFAERIHWLDGRHIVNDAVIIETVGTHTFEKFYASDAPPTDCFLLADKNERLIGWCISPYYSE